VARIVTPGPRLSPSSADQTLMADYTKYDARVDSLVIESRTFWDASVGKLTDEDKAFLAKMVHRAPAKASKIAYWRSHTGFTREITVTADDIARIYDEQMQKS
jgi:hypothetical protein